MACPSKVTPNSSCCVLLCRSILASSFLSSFLHAINCLADSATSPIRDSVNVTLQQHEVTRIKDGSINSYIIICTEYLGTVRELNHSKPINVD